MEAVLTEVNFQARYEGCTLYHDLAGYLYSKGFRLYRFYEVWGDERGGWMQGDALFIRGDGAQDGTQQGAG